MPVLSGLGKGCGIPWYGLRHGRVKRCGARGGRRELRVLRAQLLLQGEHLVMVRVRVRLRLRVRVNPHPNPNSSCSASTW